MADAALGSPVNDTIEIAGPERVPLSELIARYLNATNDPREVVSDPEARYFNVRLDGRSLVPGDHAHLGTIRLEDWLYEAPADVHVVGRNASTTTPAKFLVVLVKEKGAPVLVPVK